LVSNQQFATSTLAFNAIGTYSLTGSSSTSTLLINIPKTTVTSTPEVGYTFWGISVPIAITTAGSYTGQNTILARKSDAAFW
jgi:hypothetical protein